MSLSPRITFTPGPWFKIKMSSYQYRKSHCGDKTVVRSSYLHNGISYTGKMSSLYWIRAQYAASEWMLYICEICSKWLCTYQWAIFCTVFIHIYTVCILLLKLLMNLRMCRFYIWISLRLIDDFVYIGKQIHHWFFRMPWQQTSNGLDNCSAPSHYLNHWWTAEPLSKPLLVCCHGILTNKFL